jgi:hypothetical protein
MGLVNASVENAHGWSISRCGICPISESVHQLRLLGGRFERKELSWFARSAKF